MPAKLVAIGDSLTEGFLSGSIFKAQFSYPAMLARSLGEANFRVPDFSGEGGLPVNLENVLRLLYGRYGTPLNWMDVIPAFLSVRTLLDRTEDYWERGQGSQASSTGPLHDNLAVMGFQLGDCDTLTEAICRRNIPEPSDDFLDQIPEAAMYRVARRTLNPSFDRQYEHLSQIEAARAISQREGGIENLIFWLGANNCLSTVTTLDIKLSTQADLDPKRYAHQRTANLWRPEHFRALLERVAPQVDAIGANNVFVGTVPHVTIPPVSRGVTPGATGNEALSEDGYFQYYTHFWIRDELFSQAPNEFPYLTREEAREIDATIDQYNAALKEEANKRGWHIVDVSQMLDLVAFRRRKGQLEYEFPPELIEAIKENPNTRDRVTPQGKLLLDTRFIHLAPDNPDPAKRYEGGLFSLDGIHPTTVGYGLVAHEFLKVMQTVVSIQPLDWQAIVAADSLLVNPPLNLQNLRNTLSFLYHRTPLPKLIEIASGRMN